MKTISSFISSIIAGLLVFSCAEPSNEIASATKPNVLFIAVDDLNTYLGFLDDPNALTPNFDRLAASGVGFSNAHCQAPLCGPSRASIMTGLRPSTTGIYGMIKDDLITVDNSATENITLLPEYFSNQGYETYGVGKLFHTFAPQGVFQNAGGRFAKNKPNNNFGVAPPERMNWEGYPPPGSGRYQRTNTDWGPFPEHDSLMTDTENVNWLLSQLENVDGDKPFFMALGFLRPHVPLHVPQKWFDLYPLDSIATPPYLKGDLDDVPALVREKLSYLPQMPSTEWAIETNNWKKIIQAYLACVSYVDHEIGRILDKVEEKALSEQTIIILWSDHGYRVGEKNSFAKHALWDPATKAPLIISGPGIPEGEIYPHPTEMLDIYPTLIDLADLPPNENLEGKSLVSRINESKLGEEDIAITTYGWSNHSIRTNEWRYSLYEDGSEELYDKVKDPNEFTNLANRPEYNHVKQNLVAQLPILNAAWHQHSNYNFDQYFVDQKARLSKEMK